MFHPQETLKSSLNLTIGRMCASLPPDPSTDIFKQRSTDNEENSSGVGSGLPARFSRTESENIYTKAPLVIYTPTARWRQISPDMVSCLHLCESSSARRFMDLNLGRESEVHCGQCKIVLCMNAICS